MAECPHFEHLLVLPRLKVQNANALSSPLTHGFPAMSAFLGLMWALERKTTAQGLDVRFNAVGVVCHGHQEQATADGFVKSFCLTRNPVDKDGGTAAIVEEGRIHLELSLVFAVQSETLSNSAALSQTEQVNAIAAKVYEQLAQMRIAGGSVMPSSHVPMSRRAPYVVPLVGAEQDKRKIFERAKLRLLPGFSLVSRDDLLETRHRDLLAEDPNANRLDAWLSLSRTHWRYTMSDKKSAQWELDRKAPGWIRPIPVGYGALSGPHEPGTVTNARDADTPFCFVESLYSIGEWLSPHRLQSPQQLLWYADSPPDSGLYRCRNDYRPAQADD
jgi:CRISPR-associated protein Csy2